MADRYLSLLFCHSPSSFSGVTTTYTRHGRNTFGSRGYNRRDNIFVFSWKSEAVWYSDHDRRYLFIPKQAPLPPPRVYLSATSLLPLPSLLFNPALSIRVSLFSFLPRAGRASPPLRTRGLLFRSEIEDTDTVEHGGMSTGYRTMGGGGEAELLEGQTLLGRRLSFPCFQNGFVDGIGFIHRDIYRGKEKRFPYTRVFRCVFRDGLGLKKERKERVLNRLRDYELSMT